LSDRSEYYHKYYLEHKNKKAEKYVTTYKPYDSYVKLTTVKKILSHLKKDIGQMNYGLIMDELSKVERIRFSGTIQVETGN